MSFISESSIETSLKPPSLVFPSLIKSRYSDHITKTVAVEESHHQVLQSDIYYASQLIKLRSELRSPYSNHANPRLTVASTQLKLNNSLNDINSLTTTKHRAQSLPNVLLNFSNDEDLQSYDGKDDESEILVNNTTSLHYSHHTATRQNKFYSMGSNHLNLPSQKSLLLSSSSMTASPFFSRSPMMNHSREEQEEYNDDFSSLLSSDTEDGDLITRNNRIVISKKKPQAVFVSLSASSAAAASVAKSKRKQILENKKKK